MLDVASENDEGDPLGPVASIPQFNLQYSGGTAICDGGRASTPHGTVIIVAMGDGSVKNVSSSVSGSTWWAAATKDAGDNLGSDW